MKANIINIGNSQGIIIPSMLLRKLNLSFKSSVQLEVENGSIVIKPAPRQGWAEAALKMHAAGDDMPLLEDSLTDSRNYTNYIYYKKVSVAGRLYHTK